MFDVHMIKSSKKRKKKSRETDDKVDGRGRRKDEKGRNRLRERPARLCWMEPVMEREMLQIKKIMLRCLSLILHTSHIR